MRNFYRLTFDPDEEDLWILDDPKDPAGREITGWHFKMGTHYEQPGELRVPVYRQGKAVPFSFNVSNVPIVVRRLAATLEPLLGTNIQRIPVDVESAAERYDILNVLDVVDCVDEDRSEFTKWDKRDGRPDKVGQYHSIPKLKIDAARATGHRMFRLKGWHVDIIVDEEIKDLLESGGSTGIVFRHVS